MKIIILMILSTILISCNSSDSNYIYREFVENGEKVKGRFINDTIRDGVFTHFYPDGEIARIRFYENNVMVGSASDYYPNKSLLGYAIINKGDIFQVTFYENGDTMSIVKNKFSKSYYENSKIEMFSYLSNGYKIIAFDELGILKQYTPPLNFLTREDSLDLDRSYPDWRNQVRVWENKDGRQPIQ